jgi:histidinol-phosphate aminotransferase
MSVPIRQAITEMPGYIPGLQPRGSVVKLNTNENPHPPSPRVLEAIRDAIDHHGECACRYPDPLATTLRQALAEFDGVAPDQVVVGNGSDEILRLLMQMTLDPGSEVGILWPTYSYYEFLAAQFDALVVRHELDESWQWPPSLSHGDERLLIVATPNPPVGTLYPREAIARLCAARRDALVVSDEAYIAFAPDGSTAVSLLADHPNLVVARTLSKSHQIAGLRAGYAIGQPETIATLLKIKDSYNVNALTQSAATASIRDVAHLRATRDRVLTERRRLEREMTLRGFSVPESHGNFIFAMHPDAPSIHRALMQRGIHVRWFDMPRTRLGLRVTVGLPEQSDALFHAIDEILGTD